MTAPELKPCPFCGGLPRIDLAKKKHCQLHGDPMQAVRVYCYHQCNARPEVFAGDVFNGGEEKAKEDAIFAWNTRTDLCIRRDDPALRQVMEALEGISKSYAADQSRLIHSDAQIKAMANGAIDAMQKLIGGTK